LLAKAIKGLLAGNELMFISVMLLREILLEQLINAKCDVISEKGPYCGRNSVFLD